MEQFPPNSAKSKTRADKPKPKDEKKVERIVKSEVKVRKKGFLEKMKSVFIGGEAKTAASYIAVEVLLPAMRNMIVDASTKGIERLIYGDSSPRRPPGAPTQRVQYNSPTTRYSSRGPLAAERAYSPRGTPSYAVTDLIFNSRGEAEAVLEMMTSIIEQYDIVSVADLHELAGLQSNHTDNKWGWRSLRNVYTRQLRDGFMIDFPPVEPI